MSTATDFYSVDAGLDPVGIADGTLASTPKKIKAFCNFFDATGASKKTEPEETGHFGTTADKSSRRKYQSAVASVSEDTPARLA
jgi:hypothetical protein